MVEVPKFVKVLGCAPQNFNKFYHFPPLLSQSNVCAHRKIIDIYVSLEPHDVQAIVITVMKTTKTYWAVVEDYNNITKSSIDSHPVNVYGVIADYTIYETYNEALKTLREIFEKYYEKETDAIWHEKEGNFTLELTSIFKEKIKIKYYISPMFVQI